MRSALPRGWGVTGWLSAKGTPRSNWASELCPVDHALGLVTQHSRTGRMQARRLPECRTPFFKRESPVGNCSARATLVCAEIHLGLGCVRSDVDAW